MSFGGVIIELLDDITRKHRLNTVTDMPYSQGAPPVQRRPTCFCPWRRIGLAIRQVISFNKPKTKSKPWHLMQKAPMAILMAEAMP